MTSQGSGSSRKAALADEVATLMYELTRAWDARMDKAVADLRAKRQIALTPRQALVLWQLGEPRSMTELANTMACDQSNVTGLVDRLERAGLLERQSDPDDRRVKRLVLTAEGSRLRGRLDGLLGTEPALRRLSLSELRQLRDLLAHTLAVTTSTT